MTFLSAAFRLAAAARSDRRAWACPEYRGVERWVARHLGDVEHERRVAQIATRLFHLTRDLHNLAADDLRTLQLATAVHDVGRSVCDETHPREGARMVLTDPHLPLPSRDRRRLAYLTAFHKGKVPPVGQDGLLARVDGPDRLIRVLALLRAADALDGRKAASPRLVFALVGSRQPRLRVTCYLEADCPKARKAYGPRKTSKKFRLLEELFGLTVEVEMAHADALAMVA